MMRVFPEIRVRQDRARDCVVVSTPEQEMVFTREEMNAVVPHQREAYVATRLALFKKLIQPRITPASRIKPPPCVEPPPIDETRKDIEADIMKMYYESRQQRGPRTTFSEQPHKPRYSDWRRWKAEYDGEWD